VKITEALVTLAHARAAMDTIKLPDARRLPVASRIPFPIDSLRVAAETEKFDHWIYEVSDQTSTGKFTVAVVTPVYDAWRSWRAEVELAKPMKRREQRGGAQASQTYDPMRQMRDWMRYADRGYAPVVTIQMAPKIGQTAGSIFGNILGATAAGMSGTGYRGNYRYEYKADFLKAEVTRNGKSVEDFNVFRAIIPQVFATARWDGNYAMEDQARTGIFQCDPSVFGPDGDAFPVIHIKVWSVEKPDNPYEFDLPKATVKRTWDDFAPWRSIASVAH
jgi:hypothetical protein